MFITRRSPVDAQRQSCSRKTRRGEFADTRSLASRLTTARDNGEWFDAQNKKVTDPPDVIWLPYIPAMEPSNRP